MLNAISDRLAGRAAMLSGASLIAGGVTQIVHSQRNAGDKVVGVPGHLTVGFFVVSLICMAPSFIALARYARPGIARKAAVAAAAGTLALGATATTSLIAGHDLSLFTVMAPLTNALWLFGALVLAVSLKRAGCVPTWVAVGLPLAWAATIILATLGGGVLSGAYYLSVGLLLAGGAIQRVPQPASVRA